MREVRVLLAITPPFLADLVRAVLATRLEEAGYALTIVDERDANAQRRRDPPPAPDVVIIGPLSAVAPADTPHSRLLRLSPTLEYIHSPGDAGPAPLTADELGARVLEIVRENARKI